MNRLSPMTKVLSAITMAIAMTSLCGCGAAERAAAKDPQKCERDPDCEARQSKANDCSTACVDDRACMDRCEQVTRSR